jgi:hypothetical protein
VRGKIPDVIIVGFELMHLLKGVVIEDPDLHIVRCSTNPLLPDDKLGTAHRKIADF